MVLKGQCTSFVVDGWFRGTALCYIRLCIFDLDLSEHGQCIHTCVYHLFVRDQYPYYNLPFSLQRLVVSFSSYLFTSWFVKGQVIGCGQKEASWMVQIISKHFLLSRHGFLFVLSFFRAFICADSPFMWKSSFEKLNWITLVWGLCLPGKAKRRPIYCVDHLKDG